jgi:hypothetical protein
VTDEVENDKIKLFLYKNTSPVSKADTLSSRRGLAKSFPRERVS